MKTKTNFEKFIFTFIFLVNFSFLFAETFRVNKVHIRNVEETPNSEVTVNLGINDSLAIFIPEDKEYLEGIELKFTIPEAVAYWMDSVACSIYDSVHPIPSEEEIDYTGTKVFVRTLPNKLSWVLQIPLKKENSMKSNNYIQKLDSVMDAKNNVIFVRLQPVMKGVPEETMESVIPITIKPILSNKGRLDLTLIPPRDELKLCSVFIDDEMITFPNDKIIYLPVGVHDISIISESYRNELRTVRIEQASKTELLVNMKSIEPTLYVSAPDGTAVFLDDIEFLTLNNEVEIPEGEHKIKFVIGNYEMVRTINAIKGKTYKAIFSLDLQISEE